MSGDDLKKKIIGMALTFHPEATQLLYGVSPDSASRWVITLDDELDDVLISVAFDDDGAVTRTRVGVVRGSGRSRVLSCRAASTTDEVRLVTKNHGILPFRNIFTSSVADVSIWLFVTNDSSIQFVSEERVGPSGVETHRFDADRAELMRSRGANSLHPGAGL